MMILILYFIVGMLQDFIITLNLRYIAMNKIALSMLTSFFATFINMLVLYNILAKLDSEKTILAILIYSLGIAVGTLLAMKFKLGLKD